MPSSFDDNILNSNQGKMTKYNRAQPLINTVSNLKGATNNVRSLADTFEQLLVAVEGFAPYIEIAAKGKENFVRALSANMRKR